MATLHRLAVLGCRSADLLSSNHPLTTTPPPPLYATVRMEKYFRCCSSRSDCFQNTFSGWFCTFTFFYNNGEADPLLSLLLSSPSSWAIGLCEDLIKQNKGESRYSTSLSGTLSVGPVIDEVNSDLEVPSRRMPISPQHASYLSSPLLDPVVFQQLMLKFSALTAKIFL
ncbi:hypothetical protein J6590_054052 [Homalodisca vitripennis]|nr:hypothetical protein J6590_054052 [Homalodisca vitripennis]